MKQNAIHQLTVEWKTRINELIICHYKASQILYRNNYLFGVPVVILSAIVGTSIFAAATSKTTDVMIQIIIGCVSMLAAISASLNAYLQYSKRAEQHKETANKYSMVRDKIDELIAFYKDGKEITKIDLDEIRKEIDNIKLASPHLNTRRLRKLNLL